MNKILYGLFSVLFILMLIVSYMLVLIIQTNKEVAYIYNQLGIDDILINKKQ